MVDIRFEVTSLDHGIRLDLFLSRKMKRMSRSLAARVIKHGGVRLGDGSVLTKPSGRMFEGQVVMMRRRKLDEGPTDHIVIPLVYEDARLIMVAKPGNLIVHPTASAYRRTLIRIMRERLADDDLDLAHRIDKETSGLLIMARDSKAAVHLTKQFAKRTVEKSYLAIVVGTPEDEFEVEAPLQLVTDSVTQCLMQVGGPNAQPALTRFKVLARGDRTALVECRPKTGRQHQIRLHLAHLGHPIIGDKLYFADEDFFMAALRGDYDEQTLIGSVGHDRQALHAWQVRFRHPDDNREMTGSAPLPDDMLQLARRMKIPVEELSRTQPDLGLTFGDVAHEEARQLDRQLVPPRPMPSCAPEILQDALRASKANS
jgi:23S rRNA pseudouridine1911/1915/1917 synthase